MEQQPVPHRDVLREPGDVPSEDNLDDLEVINSNQNGTESKKRRFHPLRAVRKIFRRRTSKGSLKDEEAIMKSRSTSELHGATDRGSNSSIGDDRQSLDLSQPLYSSGLSLSHDSIFSPETPSSGQSIDGHAESNPSIQKLASSFKDELTAKLRQRQDSDYEDAGFPRSPQYTTGTTDFSIQESKRSQGKSRYSDGSHLSTGSSDADADSGQSSLHSSRICVTERKLENGDPDLDIGATTLLSNTAARHKISIRPKRTRGSAMGHRSLQQTDGYPSTQLLSPSTVLPATPEDDDEESADILNVTDSVFTFSPIYGTTDPEWPSNVAAAQEPFDIIQSVMQSRAVKVEEETNTRQETRTAYISESFYGEVAKTPMKAIHEESKTVDVQVKQVMKNPEKSKVIEDKETKFIEMFTEREVVEKYKEPRRHEEPRLAKGTEEIKVTEIARERKSTRGTADQRVVKDAEEVKVVEKSRETKVVTRSEEPRVIKDAEEVTVIEKSGETKVTRRSEEPRAIKDVEEVKVVEKTRETKVTRRYEEPPREIKEQKQDKYVEDEQFGYGSDDNSDPVTSTCFRIGRHRSRKADSEISHQEKERGEGAFSKLFGSRRSSRKKRHDEKPTAAHVNKEEYSWDIITPEASYPNSAETSPGGTLLVVQSWGERNPTTTSNGNESKYKRAISVDAKAAEKKDLAVTRSVSAAGEGGIVARLSRNYQNSQEDINIEMMAEKSLKKSSSQSKLTLEKTKPKEEEVKSQQKTVEVSTATKPPSYSAMTRDRRNLQEKVEDDSQNVVIPRASLSDWRARRQLRQRTKSPTRPIQEPLEEKVSSSKEVHLPDVLIAESDERRRKASDVKRRPIQQQLSNEDIAELEMFPRSRLSSDNKELVGNDKDDKVKAVVDSSGVKSLEIITISPPTVIRSNKRALAMEPREDIRVQVQETPIQIKTSPKEHPVNKSPVNKSPTIKDNLSPLSWKETFLEKTEIVVQYTNTNDRNIDVHVPLTTNKIDVDSVVREDNNNTVLMDTGQVNVPPRAATKLRPRPLSQNIIPNAEKSDQSELMRVFNRRSLKLKDNESLNVESAVPEKQAPVAVPEKQTPVAVPVAVPVAAPAPVPVPVVNLDCPPVVIELSSVAATEPAVVAVETTQATDAPQWRKLALLRREQRQKEYKEKSIQDTSQLIIHDASKSVSRSSKVLDMVNSFQKFQVNLTN